MSDHGTDEIRGLLARAMTDVPEPRPWSDVEDRAARPFDAPTPARRRTGVWLAAAACVVALVGGLVAVVVSDDEPAVRTDDPTGTTTTSSTGPSTSAPTSTTTLSPLVTIRSRLTDNPDVEVFRVSSDAESYWRLTALPEFDGQSWGIRESELEYLGDVAGRTLEGREIRQQIEVQALSGSLVPVAPEPIEASSQADELLWSEPLGALVATTELAPGDRFEIVSRSPDYSAEELRTATTADPPGAGYVELPSTLPAPFAETARVVTANATTDYDRLLMLQRWFQAEFEYSLEVQPGHGDSAIEGLLRTRVGYSEQFASAFAVLARTLGIPSRVAVGFTPGALRSDGWYSVFNRNSHAWPEIWFDGLGWVPFEPTPASRVVEQFIRALNDRDLAAMAAVSTDPLNIDSVVAGDALSAEELSSLLAWYDAFDWRWEDATCETTPLRADVQCELFERNRLTDLTGAERPATVWFTMTDGKVESVTVNANLLDYRDTFSQFNNWVRANSPDDASRMWTGETPVLSAESAALFDQHLTDYTDHITGGTDD